MAMLKAPSLLFLVTLASASLSESSAPQLSRVPQSAGITQLVENRRGRVSCWGVTIQLGNSRFRETIRPDQMMICEAKHGHDLRRIMSWRVEQHGKRLVIRFKPGMGDFGSGNCVEVQVHRSAFIEQVKSPNNRLEWSINTDVL
jgi:hypothetical protein